MTWWKWLYVGLWALFLFGVMLLIFYRIARHHSNNVDFYYRTEQWDEYKKSLRLWLLWGALGDCDILEFIRLLRYKETPLA